ncbi:hypothetical protein M8J77_023839 [Diaphorina citri]|nr:hypothetical protein M8J77_023839 [Diaphorina citri]
MGVVIKHKVSLPTLSISTRYITTTSRIPTGVVGHQPESSSHKRNLNAGELLLFSIVWFETISSCSCFSGVFIKSQGSGRL